MESCYDINKILEITSVELSFEAEYTSDFYFSGETHDFWEMIYVFDGTICVSADDRIYELNSDEVIFHKPMEFHRIWSLPNTSSHAFIISYTIKGDSYDFEKLVIKLSPQQKQYLMNFITYLREASIDINKEQFKTGKRTWYCNPQVPQIAGNLLEIYLLSILSKYVQIKKEKATDKRTIQFKNIIKVLYDNIGTNISVDEIAKKCNISVSGLKKIFTKYAGMSIHRYFLILKISRAINMMQDDIPICDISNELGFDNQNYFSTVFKRITGYSPTEYKKNGPFIDTIK